MTGDILIGLNDGVGARRRANTSSRGKIAALCQAACPLCHPACPFASLGESFVHSREWKAENQNCREGGIRSREPNTGRDTATESRLNRSLRWYPSSLCRVPKPAWRSGALGIRNQLPPARRRLRLYHSGNCSPHAGAGWHREKLRHRNYAREFVLHKLNDTGWLNTVTKPGRILVRSLCRGQREW